MPTDDDQQLTKGLVVFQGLVNEQNEPTWKVSLGYGNDDYAVVYGYLRKKDAEIAMHALYDSGIDWTCDRETLIKQARERFGTRKEMERWVNEHLQW